MSVRASRPGPTTATMRVCARVEPEAKDGSVVHVGLHDTYGVLEDELPLGGAAAMRESAGGGLLLTDALRARLPWMKSAIALVERQLRVALWAGRPWIQFRPFCLAGPPGVGKSELAREIGRLAGLRCSVLDLGAMHDAAALVAVSRGWTNTKPCWPAQAIASGKCANPVLVLDEIEEAGGSRRNGDPLTALLGMLEPSTARAYFDTCLMVPLDLSAVCWICTANDPSRIPGPLASRLDVVEVPRPGVEHFDGLTDGLLAAMAARWGVHPATMPPLPPRALSVLREAFARHRSVRRLKRQVEDVVATLVTGTRRDLH